ncbi:MULTISPECIES: hypothetical protein [Legionella]|uniref:Secreted protein n=1 Tax=Legionella drozanskii LLAP-1 TaxID=1212489 RepID=A0A0W0SLP3_9GAMM|nr:MULTISPECIES: hypothetical protein [Legionella]KTC84259.1 hypothetical protein Ldro_3065 [Legionella drozanskii LLAP-1]PJE06933.1 MAG: hypothetical protein CK430_14565 [Legionella sp.]
MRLISALIVALLYVGSNSSFAEKILILAPPTTGGLNCHGIYNDAAPSKSTTNIVASAKFACANKGGLRVIHGIYGDDKQPQGVLLSCVGDTSERVLFACYFPKN